MERVLMVDLDKCTACRICELVCSLIVEGEHNPAKSRIRIVEHYEADVAIPLISTECPPKCERCVEFCPTECLWFVTMQEAVVYRKGTTLGSIPVPRMARPAALY